MSIDLNIKQTELAQFTGMARIRYAIALIWEVLGLISAIAIYAAIGYAIYIGYQAYQLNLDNQKFTQQAFKATAPKGK